MQQQHSAISNLDRQQRPTAAEIARTIVAGPYAARVQPTWIDAPAHVSFTADARGRIMLFVSDGHALARVSCLHADTPAVLGIDAVSAIQGTDRRIGELALAGSVAPDTPVDAAAALARYARARGAESEADLGRLWTLEFRPTDITLKLRLPAHRGHTVAPVDPVAQTHSANPAWAVHSVAFDDYVAAEADPLAVSAHNIAHHLNTSHRDVLLELVPDVAATSDIAIVGLDRYGLDVLIGQTIRRICFHRPLTRPEQLGRELFALRRLRVDA